MNGGAVSDIPSLLGRPVGANGDETRQRILDATMRCVAEIGYARATIREIAKLAKVTSGSLYHYFPNKSELVRATFDEMARMSVPRVAAAAQRDQNYRDRLMAVLDECDQMMREYPLIAAFDRAIRVESTQHLHLAENADTMFTNLRGVLVDIFEQARREDALQPGVDVEAVSTAIWVILRGLTDYAATAPVDEYHATVIALKQLINGNLFL
jgi:AcrR family transcriptional regulator